MHLTERDSLTVTDSSAFITSGFASIWQGSLILEGHTIPQNVAVKVFFVREVRRGTEAYEAAAQKLREHVGYEASCWWGLEHPHITPLLRFVSSCTQIRGETGPALITPYRAYGNLREYAAKNPKCNRLLLLQQAVRGLHFLHTRKPQLLHLDIKPENILVNDREEAEICDFGFVKMMDGSESGPSYGLAATPGTHPYIAPEILLNETTGYEDDASQPPIPEALITLFVDSYSFGGTLLTVMSGVAPWSASPNDYYVPTIRAQTKKSLVPPVHKHPIVGYHDDVVKEIWDVVARCLALEASSRPSALELIETLQSIIKLNSLRSSISPPSEMPPELPVVPLIPADRTPQLDEITERGFLEVTDSRPFITSGYASIWKGDFVLEGAGTRMTVAIKVFEIRHISRDSPDYEVAKQKARAHLMHELRCWVGIGYRHVTPLLGWVSSFTQIRGEPTPALITPFRADGNLREYVTANPSCDRLLLLQQAARGLHFLHTREPQLLHFDVKPENVLVNDQGEAEICDFGFVKIMDGSPSGMSYTLSATPGTHPYTAPEFLHHGKGGDDDEDIGSQDESDQSLAIPEELKTPFADIYSFGVTVLTVMSGKVPWVDGGRDVAIKMALLVAKQQSLVPSRTKHPIHGYETVVVDAVWDIVERCLAYETSSRPLASELITVLQSVIELKESGRKVIVPPPASPRPSLQPSPFEDTAEAAEITTGYNLDLGTRFSVGTYADVYKATFLSQGSLQPHLAAVKVLRFYGMNVELPELYKQNLVQIDKRLDREMNVWKSLSSPRITPLIGYLRGSGNLTSDDLPVLISPYRENSNIRTYLLKNPEADRLLLLQQACEGLEYLHSHDPSIAHLGLKPENILINDKGEAELCDFGLAAVLEDLRTRISTEESHFSPRESILYKAPESLNEGDCTTASDIYGMGCVILDVITGVPPWGNTKPLTILSQVSRGQTPPDTLHVISGYPQSVVNAVWALMKRCWALDPLDRPQASDVRDELINIRTMVLL